jgi:hypothetical protein
MQSQSVCWSQVAYLLLLSDNAKQLNLEAVNAERRWLTITETLTQADSASTYCLRIQGSRQPPCIQKFSIKPSNPPFGRVKTWLIATKIISQMARVAHAAGYRSNSGNGIIAGFPRPFLWLLFFWPLGKEK